MKFGDSNPMTKPYENSKFQWDYLLTIVQALVERLSYFLTESNEAAKHLHTLIDILGNAQSSLFIFVLA